MDWLQPGDDRGKFVAHTHQAAQKSCPSAACLRSPIDKDEATKTSRGRVAPNSAQSCRKPRSLQLRNDEEQRAAHVPIDKDQESRSGLGPCGQREICDWNSILCGGACRREEN